LILQQLKSNEHLVRSFFIDTPIIDIYFDEIEYVPNLEPAPL